MWLVVGAAVFGLFFVVELIFNTYQFNREEDRRVARETLHNMKLSNNSYII